MEQVNDTTYVCGGRGGERERDDCVVFHMWLQVLNMSLIMYRFEPKPVRVIETCQFIKFSVVVRVCFLFCLLHIIFSMRDTNWIFDSTRVHAVRTKLTKQGHAHNTSPWFRILAYVLGFERLCAGRGAYRAWIVYYTRWVANELCFGLDGSQVSYLV